jgi:hypothetical protein
MADHGEWAFRIGQRSAGSTSPLWTLLLSVGFLIDLAPYVWTYLLGWVILTLMAVHAENIARKLVAEYKSRIPWVGLFFVFAWHLTWSAVSGMETLLHALIIFVVLSTLIRGPRRYLALGVLAGLSIWVRPDGITLLGPILFAGFLSEKSWSARAEMFWKTLLGFGALFFPYLLFNLMLSGNPLPNTSCQAGRVRIVLVIKGLERLVIIFTNPGSPFIVLIPLQFGGLSKHTCLKLAHLPPDLVSGYISLTLRYCLHITWRYIIPALPIMYLWGILGFLELISSHKINRRIVLVWQVLTVFLTLAFLFIGAQQNANDVFWIETEMVRTAQWVEQNVPADAQLAVHDIGALGYYVQNPILDMAGLTTPEIALHSR